MSPLGPLPVTLVGGFLGAGKTTLLQNMLRDLAGHRVAVLVNDFGDLQIDADLVESLEQDVLRLKGGCMCCAIRDTAVGEVLRLAEQATPPEHVIIEASGASDTAALRDTFRELERHQTVRLHGLITVVDAEAFEPDHPQVGLLQRCQVMAADVVVLNKVDRVSAEQLEALKSQVLKIAPQARLWPTEYAQVPREVLLGIRLNDAPRTLAHAAPAEAMLSSAVLQVPGPVPGRAVVAWLAGLPRAVFRAKGFLRLAERPEDRVLLQVVSGRVHVQTQGHWSGPSHRAELVLIGLKDEVDYACLQSELRALAQP